MKKNIIQTLSFIFAIAALLYASGIVPAIVPTAVPPSFFQGTATSTTKFQGATGTTTMNHAPIYDATGLLIDSGQGLGGGSTAPLFTSTATATISSGTQGTIVGTGVGSTTVPAGYFNTAGAVLGVQAQGTFTTAGTPGSLTLLISLGGTTVATGTEVLTANAGSTPFSVSCFIVTRVTGATGTLMSNCVWVAPNGSTSVAEAVNLNDQAQSFNLTGTLAFDMQAHWNAFATGDAISGTTIVLYTPGGTPSGPTFSNPFILTGTTPVGLNYQFQPLATTNYAFQNQASATLDTATTAAWYFTLPTAGSDNIMSYVKNVPAKPYTVKMAMSAIYKQTNTPEVGLCESDGTKVEIVSVGEQSSTNNAFRVSQWTNATTFSSNATGNLFFAAPATLIWFQVQDNSTNRIYSIGIDGQHWHQLLSESDTAFLTPTKVGVCANSGNNGQTVEIQVLSIPQ